MHQPKSKKGSQSAALLKSYLKFFFILSTASISFSRSPNADNRKYPSPLGPKQLPSVPTTQHSFNSLSKKEKIT